MFYLNLLNPSYITGNKMEIQQSGMPPNYITVIPNVTKYAIEGPLGIQEYYIFYKLYLKRQLNNGKVIETCVYFNDAQIDDFEVKYKKLDSNYIQINIALTQEEELALKKANPL